jgi:amino acid adenylation domain-containing protein
MNRTIHELVESVADAMPDRVAMEFGNEPFSYSDLKDGMDEIASACHQADPSGRGVVMVLLPKGIEFVVSILGIFKAGKIFLPAAWSMGESTWRAILTGIRPDTVVTTEQQLPPLLKMCGEMEVEIKNLLLVSKESGKYAVRQWRGASPLKPYGIEFVNVLPTDSAYLYFTSGTTGTPRIVEGSHQSLVHFINWQVQEFEYSQDSRVSNLAAITFDASLKDIFPPLLSGGCLCIPEEDDLSDSTQLLKWIRRKSITIMATVPSVFRTLLNEIEANQIDRFTFPELRYCLLAGEPLYNKDVYRWQKALGDKASLVNLYGTTESTILKSFYRIGPIKEESAESVPVGRPIPDTRILIINQKNQVCPAGERGEVFIKTPYLSKGYFANPEETKKIFVTNPLSTDQDDVVYKTGDYGEYTEDGNILIKGRGDTQVKIRGVRVDLAAIASALLACDNVTQVKCIAVGDGQGNLQNACYYTANGGLSEDDLKEYSRKVLNAYEIPDIFVCLPKFPVTRHGKMDIAALPDPFMKLNGKAGGGIDTLTDTEQKLKEIWEGLLGCSALTADDSFFAAGGNSLKALQFGSLVKRNMKIQLGVAGLKQLFATPRLREFATYLDRLLKTGDASEKDQINPVPPGKVYPLSHAQYQAWMASQVADQSRSYNMSQSWLIKGPLDIGLLREALRRIVSRHEILRTKFTEEQGTPGQTVCDSINFETAFSWYEPVEGPGRDLRIEKRILSCMEEPFDLTIPGLFRVLIIQLDKKEFNFTWCIHHIIGDSWSAVIFARELIAYYHSLKSGIEPVLPSLNIQYKDYAVYERNKLTGESLRTMESFWRGHLGSKLPVLNFKTDRDRGVNRSWSGKRYEFEIPAGLLTEISTFAAAYNRSLFSILLSAYYLALYKYSNDEEIVVGIPTTTRSMPQLENQIGLYVNIIALKANISGKTSVLAFLGQIAEILVKGLEYHEYPFTEILTAYSGQRVKGHNPVFDFGINMLTAGQRSEMPMTEDLTISDLPEKQLHTHSKFDLTLYVYDQAGQSASPFIEYNTDLFDEDTIARFSSKYKAILSRIPYQSHNPIRELIRETITLPQIG